MLNQAINCAKHADDLNLLHKSCSGSTLGTIGCESFVLNNGTAVWFLGVQATETPGCSSVINVLNSAIVEFTRNTTTTAIECQGTGFLGDKTPTTDSTNCMTTAAHLNLAIAAFNDGTFEDCKMTTPTTSQTSSPTQSTPTTSHSTSATTSLTSTPLDGKLKCIFTSNTNLLVLESSENCVRHVDTLNSLYHACTGEAGTISCLPLI